MKFRSGAGLATAALLLMTASGWASEPLVNEVTVNAPAEKVWQAFTVQEQIEQWMVPSAVMDLEVGGSLRTTYDTEEGIPGPNSIEHRILSFEPNRMLSMRVVKCPEGFEFAEQLEQTWSVITMQEIAPGVTHVRIAGLGYGEGPVWEKMRRYFTAGNDWTFQKLRHFVEGETAFPSGDEAERALDLLHRMTGGEWIAEGRMPDDTMFRVRNVLEHGPDGRSVLSRGWLGDEQGMYFHSLTQIHADPTTGTVQFQSIDQDGALSRGAIRAVVHEALAWDWHHLQQDGTAMRFNITTTFEGDDAYTMSMKQVDAADEPPFVVRFTRVERAPARFRSLRQGPNSAETGND